MISILDSMTGLEHAEKLRANLLECYVAAIRNAARYAVELEEGVTEPHRKYLTRLASEVSVGEMEGLLESRATLRGLLRDYREKAARYIGDLRNDLANSAKALQQLTESLQQSDCDHESSLGISLARLREISRAPECGLAGPAVLAAAGAIEQSVDTLRQQHQLTIAQFLVEIRMLHKRIDALERASMLDSVNKLLTRTEMEDRIREAGTQAFTLVLARVNGFQAAARLFSPAVASELAAAFSKRLHNGLPPDAAVARWHNEEFVVMTTLNKAEAIARAKWIADNLSGAYACLKDGKTVRPLLTVTVAVVERIPGDSAGKVLARVAEFLKQ
jgi:GGDEF domain-containing protein